MNMQNLQPVLSWGARGLVVGLMADLVILASNKTLTFRQTVTHMVAGLAIGGIAIAFHNSNMAVCAFIAHLIFSITPIGMLLTADGTLLQNCAYRAAVITAGALFGSLL